MGNVKNKEYIVCPQCKQEVYKEAVICPFCKFGIMAWLEGEIDEKGISKESSNEDRQLNALKYLTNWYERAVKNMNNKRNRNV